MARRGKCGGYLLAPFIFGIVTILPRNSPTLSLGYIYFGVNQVWFTVTWRPFSPLHSSEAYKLECHSSSRCRTRHSSWPGYLWTSYNSYCSSENRLCDSLDPQLLSGVLHSTSRKRECYTAFQAHKWSAFWCPRSPRNDTNPALCSYRTMHSRLHTSSFGRDRSDCCNSNNLII